MFMLRNIKFRKMFVIMVKIYKRGAFIDAWYDNFFKWNNRERYVECASRAILKKNRMIDKIHDPLIETTINTPNRRTLSIRCALKWKPHENPACVYLTRTILQMEMESDFKKNVLGRRGFFLSTWGVPLCGRPHANHVPLSVGGVYD